MDAKVKNILDQWPKLVPKYHNIFLIHFEINYLLNKLILI